MFPKPCFLGGEICHSSFLFGWFQLAFLDIIASYNAATLAQRFRPKHRLASRQLGSLEYATEPCLGRRIPEETRRRAPRKGVASFQIALAEQRRALPEVRYPKFAP